MTRHDNAYLVPSTTNPDSQFHTCVNVAIRYTLRYVVKRDKAHQLEQNSEASKICGTYRFCECGVLCHYYSWKNAS